MTTAEYAFGAFVAAAAADRRVVVQPRMGFSSLSRTRAGLEATRDAARTTAGTITVDSYTRVGDHASARRALTAGEDLNGFPIVAHGADAIRRMLDGVRDRTFPVQVRHGSADPRPIVATALAAGLDATEGGPISYCLPYSRTPLTESVSNWARCAGMLAAGIGPDREPHLETFGGCMLGQLTPPAMLVALSLLEALFFAQHGLRSVSLSYAQQTNEAQDREAVGALRTLAAERLGGLDWHIVVYAYMGLYPRTAHGASRLLRQAARLTVHSGAARLIVKTTAEAYRIPTVAENVQALRTAERAAARARTAPLPAVADTGVLAQARALIEAVLDLDPDVGTALIRAFRHGYLDVPYCLHPDNQGRTRSFLDGDGVLRWSRIGSLPLGDLVEPTRHRMRAGDLLAALSYVQRTFDEQRGESHDAGTDAGAT
ncbi:methylaspartate mutase [Nonomuraea sp. NPDC047529]|uniref:methylaspartate mutase n=1 Tax=Nonomuraea sp. NPDC047529 TaxID=3155623 RepID=UPI0034017BD8